MVLYVGLLMTCWSVYIVEHVKWIDSYQRFNCFVWLNLSMNWELIFFLMIYAKNCDWMIIACSFFFQIHRLFTHVPASCDFNIWIPLLVLFFWIYYNSLYWYWASTLVFAEFWWEKIGSLLLFFMHLAYLPTCSWLLHKV